MSHEQGGNNQVQPVVLCLGFHRVLSSGVANWLHHAGLNMGQYLMPPAVSNPEGHYEDMAFVDLHERLLQMNGTQWRFHDELPFEAACRLDLLARYVQRRDAIVGGPWGAKDPRVCLFADAWCRVLGERGRYLVLLRHWSGSVQSLYQRHSQTVALFGGNLDEHASFWRSPEQAARMWLAYYRSVLPVLERHRAQCLVVTQQAVLAGLPLIEQVNARFGLALDVGTPSPIRPTLSHDRVEEGVRVRLPAELVDELEGLWQQLLAQADHRVADESPQWVPDRDDAPMLTARLLALAAAHGADAAPRTACPPEDDLQQALKTLAEQPERPLDVAWWQGRIRQEARFVPECWEWLARAQLNRGDALGAEVHLAQVLVCGKSAAYLFLLLGQCREAELDDEGAVHFYRLAIARNDANAVFHVRLCRVWLVQGRYDAAEQHLRAALQRHPDTPALLHALANCLDQQGRTDEAIALLAAQSAPSSQLVRQLASLRMKQDPEQAQMLQRSITLESAGKLETQQTVVKALASVEDLAARRDLARRVASVWQRLGVESTIPEGAPTASKHTERKCLNNETDL